MNGGKSVEVTEERVQSHNDICVLLLDSNKTYLMNMSDAIRRQGHRVVTTSKTDDLMRIINDEKIGLVLAEFRLIRNNNYELLKTITSSYEIPVVVAGEDVDKTVIEECLKRGVEFYLTKPLSENDLKNLWQFTMRILRQIDPEKKETEDEVIRGSKRKERANTYTNSREPLVNYGSGFRDQKKQKLVQSSKHVTNVAANVGYAFDERDFIPLLESIGESTGHHRIITSSPRESTNKEDIARLKKKKKTHRALDEEMEDGISLFDLEFDKQEGQDSNELNKPKI